MNDDRTHLKRLPTALALLLLVGVALVTLAGADADVAGPSGAWSLVPSPNTGSPNNYFFGVAAVASNDVWAVGAFGVQGVTARQLIEHWNGTKWSRSEGPPLNTPSELLAVSASDADDVWAVGGYNVGGKALIQHWDGSTWTVAAHPNPGTFNRFLGVAAISSDDVWAVGLFGNGGLNQTLVEHWDGTSWRVIPSPNVANQHNQLNAVTAVPGSPNELWAVGTAGPSALILHWNGTQWSIVPSPNVGIAPTLTSVVAISADDVWAIGYAGSNSGQNTLTEHWNGSTWSVVPSPNPSNTYNFLRGVTAVATDNVWAVGDFNATGGNGQTLLLQWNGTAWAQVTGDNTGPSGLAFRLDAVSAIDENDVWAVGSNSHTLAEHWDGTDWSIVASPNAGTGDNVLNSVSGVASTDVWEAGYFSFGTEKRTLIERWNGIKWSIVPSPNSTKRTNVLNGVVSISPSNAWAVGSADSGNAFDQITLTLRWNGASWIVIPSPSPGTAGFNALYGVDATSANDVWAVGSAQNSGGDLQTLVEHWDGTSWSVVPSANVPGTINELYGVVALGPNNVWAVGYSGRGGAFSTLVEHWDGSSWSIVPSPNPQGPSILRAVSGTGASDVWAVGDETNVFIQTRHALIEHWDGDSWSIVPGVSPIPGPTILQAVAAVSPGDAWATGFTGAFALIERWDGTRWGVFPSPSVVGRLHAASAITACDVWAVGQRYVENRGFLTLNQRFTCN